MANLEHLTKLKEDVAAWNRSRKDDRDAPNLRETDPCGTHACLQAIPGQKPQLKPERVAKRQRLHHLLVIGFLFIAVMLIFAPILEAQYVDSGTWLGATMTGELPQSMNNAKGSWRLWMGGQVRLWGE